MKAPWVNLLLLFLVAAQTITGYFGLVNSREQRAWVLWLHGIIAYALVLILYFKSIVILDAWRRKKRWTPQRAGFVLTLILLMAVLLSGLLWTYDGPILIGGISLVSWHIYLAVPLLFLMLWHARQMRFILRVKGATGRRPFIGGLAAVVGGLALWVTTGRLKGWVDLAGARRRFTGSYEIGSFTTDFPVVSWIADRPPQLDVTTWRLRIQGAANRPVTLTYEQLQSMPQQRLTEPLDCTGGWYSNQTWQGIALADLMELAGVGSSIASVTIQSLTGYKRRFALAEACGFLLALGTVVPGPDGEPTAQVLSRGHGFPARLVAPGRRGMEWVKWVSAVQFNETGPVLQSPLPLQ